MNDRSSEAPPRTFAFVAVLVLGALGGWLTSRCSADEEPEAPAVVTEVRPTPSVIVSVKKLARLEGAVFSIERVVDLKEKQSRFFELVQAEDAILLVASGEVTAGVDLGTMREEDIEIDREKGRVRIRLPRATVFSKRLDSERTYVHTRKTDVLATRRENLETRARQEAERTLEAAARDTGILRTAEDSVARTVEVLVRSLGYSDVEIVFDDTAAPGAEGAPQPHEERK